MNVSRLYNKGERTYERGTTKGCKLHHKEEHNTDCSPGAPIETWIQYKSEHVM